MKKTSLREELQVFILTIKKLESKPKDIDITIINANIYYAAYCF